MEKTFDGGYEITDIDNNDLTPNTPENFIANIDKIIDPKDSHHTPFLLADVFVRMLDDRPELFYGNQKIILFLENRLLNKDILYINKRLIEFLVDRLKGQPREGEKITAENTFTGPKEIFLQKFLGEIYINVENQEFPVTSFDIVEADGQETDSSIQDVTGDSHFTLEADGEYPEYTDNQIDFNYFFNQPVREIIEGDLNINYSDYSSDELFCFFTFLKKQNQEGFNRVKEFISKYGVDIIHLFSILNNNHNKEELILNLGNNFSESEISDIVTKYIQLMGMDDQVESFVRSGTNKYTEQFEEKDNDDEIAKYIKRRDLRSEVGFLNSRINARLKKTFLEMIEEPVQANKDKVEGLKGDVLIVTSTLEYIKKTNGRVNPEEFKDFDLQKGIKGSEITKKDFADIKRIYQENYVKYPELQKIVVDSFEKSMSSPLSLFTILRFKGEITGFYRVDTLDDNDVHFAAFNVDKNFRGVGLGEAMMFEDLDLFAKEKIIHAECDPVVPISSNYIERGFVGIDLGQIGEKGILKIVRDNKEIFETKQKMKEEFVKEYLQFETDGGVGECDKGDYLIVKTPTQKEIDMSYLDKGYILTRYFAHTINEGGEKKEWYAVFEKK